MLFFYSSLPPQVTASILFAGILLALYRPYWGFLFSVFCLIAINSTTLFSSFLFSRYFNLFEIFLLISLVSLIRDGNRLKVPKIIEALCIVIIAATFISFARYESLYLTLRAFRWVMTLPLYFIIASSLIQTEFHLKLLFRTILAASILACCQYILWFYLFRSALSTTSNFDPNSARNISFIVVGSQYAWLVAGPFFGLGKKISFLWFQVLIGIIFFISILLTQTRSIVISIFLGFLLIQFWLPRKKNKLSISISKRVAPFSLAVLLMFLVSIYFGFGTILDNFKDRFLETSQVTRDLGNITKSNDPYLAKVKDYRAKAFYRETDDWLGGNIIVGEGIFYYQRDGYGIREQNTQATGAAYGHLGYIAYLSQLGLIGFFVYGIWFPIFILRFSKKMLILYEPHPEVRHLAILIASLCISNSVLFVFSSSYVSSPFTCILAGILAGAAWKSVLVKQHFRIKVNY